MNDVPLFLDVNIPMYAAGKPHPYKEACAWVMTRIAEEELIAAIDSEIIQEIMYRYGAMKRWELAVAMSRNLLDLMPIVYPIQPADMHLAVDLFEKYAHRGINARDTLHTAVMRNNQLSRIISTDRHFDHLPGITRIDPQHLFEQNTD